MSKLILHSGKLTNPPVLHPGTRRLVVARQTMPKRVPMNVSLTAELASFVIEKVASGRYGGANEVVRKRLRLLEEKEPCSSPASSTAHQADTARHEP